jgi:hypothetical protein
MRIDIAWKMLLIFVVINAKWDTLECRKRSVIPCSLAN